MDATTLRAGMVERQIAARGVRDRRVLQAMREVPRERFVGELYQDRAYEDGPLAIGSGQTISQPYVVALMVEALGLVGTEKVLEIGTGSGYGAAVLGGSAATSTRSSGTRSSLTGRRRGSRASASSTSTSVRATAPSASPRRPPTRRSS